MADARVLLDEQYPADSRCVGLARRAAGEAARSAGLPEERTWDMMLAVSEAVTNAVVHGFVGRKHPGHVGIRAEAREGEIVVTVEDDGIGPRPRTDSPGLGLGLPTIAAVAATMDVRHLDGNGTQLCFSFPLGSKAYGAAA
ncbi:MAG TPA: ATP-binding protein [Solirubrobacteraceae bacterium]|nr:ATP-binding protein [Solirubrobacteraceae bacterium]